LRYLLILKILLAD